ncbi:MULTISPECIES: outer membrane lipoprotein carrier protein LolA [Aminobacter]|jgi:outer membrane lipoprotein-sorting protein|uniref:Membrane protein n=2 Tax=Aminobacter TaxID=31988 RepID=A0AAC9AQA5_AMIAI|nr:MULTISPECIES: outer membrane lipoprotein carrier protein LolA [Aminobacter]AMS39960.1 membrane protein [Aminobacter aminovorans]MBA8906271.1 outer membrane lipoprotein-sorting protein [Aminobacter ciceronei]MBA9020050.1 outer membrane lipoprotein-sorting protein [Aminobacter ciceronei]MBB3707248.1 outer membrane lipoprotein-sorting protein [Aminobacter aminovorans]MRX36182.1 outer membrane lipoprotein carrier protein LolA [Aminobacter sp. MDW-2]
MNDIRTPTRRRLLGFAAAIALTATPLVAFNGPVQAQGSDAAQRIADHFSSVRSMSGEFVQFGPRGEQTGGKFFLQRPGKIRFNYEAPSNFKVISDGQSVVILNSKMRTSDLYPLSKTPLKLLLDERIDLSGNKVKSVTEEDDLTTIKLSDKQVFGNSTITMMFDPKTYELRQWTITDAQGKDTTVMVFNVKQGGSFPGDTFKIDYKLNRELNAQKKGD